MRHPRAMIFNFTEQSCEELIDLFQKRGFEILTFRKAIECPLMLTGREKRKTCLQPVSCSDVMVIVEESGHRTGVDFLAQLASNKCKLMLTETALFTHAPDSEAAGRAYGHDMTASGNPIDLSALGAWVESCKARLDLSQRLATIRREMRELCVERIHVRIPDDGTVVDAAGQVVNMSRCGACVLTTYPLERGQPLRIAGLRTTDTEDGVVRWVNKLDARQYRAGVSFCV